MALDYPVGSERVSWVRSLQETNNELSSRGHRKRLPRDYFPKDGPSPEDSSTMEGAKSESSPLDNHGAPVNRLQISDTSTELADELPGILSFSLPFNMSDSPALLVEYLRSYENYGKAVVWVTKGAPPSDFEATDGEVGASAENRVKNAQRDLQWSARRALEVARTARNFHRACLHSFNRPKDHHERDRLKYSPDCSHITAGTWSDPSTLDGNWPDHSSQVVVHRVFGRPRLEHDIYLPGQPLAVHLEPDGDIFVRHSPHERVRTLGVGGTQIGEVHFMMVPWSTEDNPGQQKFKVTGLRSC